MYTTMQTSRGGTRGGTPEKKPCRGPNHGRAGKKSRYFTIYSWQLHLLLLLLFVSTSRTRSLFFILQIDN